MASNYDLRKSKRKSHADYDKDYDEEENPPPKKTQRVNGGRRNSVAKKQGPVVDNHKPEQDLIQAGCSTSSTGTTRIMDKTFDGSPGSGTCKFDDLDSVAIIDTPPASVVVPDDNSMGISEYVEDNSNKNPKPNYSEQNKLLYDLYRERLARSGAPDLYNGFKGGYQASFEPWRK